MDLSLISLDLILQKGKLHTARIRLKCYWFLRCWLSGAWADLTLHMYSLVLLSKFSPHLFCLPYERRVSSDTATSIIQSGFCSFTFFLFENSLGCTPTTTRPKTKDKNSSSLNYWKPAGPKASEFIRFRYSWTVPAAAPFSHHILLWVTQAEPPFLLHISLMLLTSGFISFLNFPQYFPPQCLFGFISLLISVHFTVISKAQLGPWPAEPITSTGSSEIKAPNIFT